jgi:hypothetical protein
MTCNLIVCILICRFLDRRWEEKFVTSTSYLFSASSWTPLISDLLLLLPNIPALPLRPENRVSKKPARSRQQALPVSCLAFS